MCMCQEIRKEIEKTDEFFYMSAFGIDTGVVCEGMLHLSSNLCRAATFDGKRIFLTKERHLICSSNLIIHIDEFDSRLMLMYIIYIIYTYIYNRPGSTVGETASL